MAAVVRMVRTGHSARYVFTSRFLSVYEDWSSLQRDFGEVDLLVLDRYDMASSVQWKLKEMIELVRWRTVTGLKTVLVFDDPEQFTARIDSEREIENLVSGRYGCREVQV